MMWQPPHMTHASQGMHADLSIQGCDMRQVPLSQAGASFYLRDMQPQVSCTHLQPLQFKAPCANALFNVKHSLAFTAQPTCIAPGLQAGALPQQITNGRKGCNSDSPRLQAALHKCL